MTRSPASPLDVVRKHYRRMAGTLTFGKTAGADPAAVCPWRIGVPLGAGPVFPINDLIKRARAGLW
jgi:hypothetical protein